MWICGCLIATMSAIVSVVSNIMSANVNWHLPNCSEGREKINTRKTYL